MTPDDPAYPRLIDYYQGIGFLGEGIKASFFSWDFSG
jgi:hypothetical protein